MKKNKLIVSLMTFVILVSSCSNTVEIKTTSPNPSKSSNLYISDRKFITQSQTKLREILGDDLQGILFYQSDPLYGDYFSHSLNLYSVKKQTIVIGLVCDGPGAVRFSYKINERDSYIFNDPQDCSSELNWITTEFVPTTKDIEIEVEFNLSKAVHRFRYIIAKKE